MRESIWRIMLKGVIITGGRLNLLCCTSLYRKVRSPPYCCTVLLKLWGCSVDFNTFTLLKPFWYS